MRAHTHTQTHTFFCGSPRKKGKNKDFQRIAYLYTSTPTGIQLAYQSYMWFILVHLVAR